MDVRELEENRQSLFMPLSEPNPIRVHFLGRPMAKLVQAGDPPEYALEFDRAFLETGHDLSPLTLPRERIEGRPLVFQPGVTSPFEGGLPGLLSDSLPDAWGRKLQNKAYPGLKTVLGKFAAVGTRGPGALTFHPEFSSVEDTEAYNLQLLAEEAKRLDAGPEPLKDTDVDAALARAGSSLGGVHPKMTTYLPAGGGVLPLENVLIGGKPPAGYVPCILKFSKDDDEGGGSVEYAYSLMAKKAGIDMADCYLINDGKRRHFATARFDRIVKKDCSVRNLHVHTLSGMLNKRAADGAIDYEELIRLARRLGGAPAAEECLRRGIFNILAISRDDHGRNHSFRYDDERRLWSLSPAYDLNPNVVNVLIGLSWLGSMEVPTSFGKLARLGEIGGVKAKRAWELYGEVQEAVDQWPEIARKVGVPQEVIATWRKEMEVQSKVLRADARSMTATQRPKNRPKNS